MRNGPIDYRCQSIDKRLIACRTTTRQHCTETPGQVLQVTHEGDPLEELPRRIRLDPAKVRALSDDFKHLRLIESERFPLDRR